MAIFEINEKFYEVDDVLEAFSLSALTINAFWPPNHKKCFGFALLCLWNVQIQKEQKWKKMKKKIFP